MYPYSPAIKLVVSTSNKNSLLQKNSWHGITYDVPQRFISNRCAARTGNENKESMFSPLNGLIDVQTDNAFYLIHSTLELQGEECLILFLREGSGVLRHYLLVLHLWSKPEPLCPVTLQPAHFRDS